ncbi:MAG: NUDIX domain-containing protein [archaeon]
MALRMDKSREKIFKQFLYSERLRFSELHKETRISSNLLAYFLKKMLKEGTLEKRGLAYKLTEKAEKLIPFFGKDTDIISPLVVILIACRNEGKILLIKRDKRPYKGFWSLPSGRLLINESIKDSVKRIMKEKTFAEMEFLGIKSVIYERLIEKDKSKHGFVFF